MLPLDAKSSILALSMLLNALVSIGVTVVVHGPKMAFCMYAFSCVCLSCFAQKLFCHLWQHTQPTYTP